MDLLEEYAHEVRRAIEYGEVVEPILGMHFYIVEEEYIPIESDGEYVHNEWLFANRKSADEFRLQRMYAYILERIQQGLHTEFIAKALSDGYDLRGEPNPMSFEVASRIATEINGEGNSETLRQWFLAHDVDFLKIWYGVYLHSNYTSIFQNSYYVFDTKLNSDYSRISDAQIWDDAPELLSESGLFASRESHIELPRLESEEEIRVAMLLGAQIDTVAGMTIYLVNKHPSNLDSGEINTQKSQPFFYATSEESAKIARTIYQFDQLNRQALFVSGGKGTIHGNVGGAIHWMQSHKIDNLEGSMISYQRSKRAYFDHARIEVRVLEDDFALTYESLRDAERVLVA